MPGGFPLLVRMDFGHSREELVIRAFLGQPVIVYGHHDVFAHGTAVLESFADEINALGAVRWTSPSGIARAAVETRRRHDALDVRMLGRRVGLDVPAGVTEVRIDAARRRALRAPSLLAADSAGEIVLGAADTPPSPPPMRRARLVSSCGLASPSTHGRSRPHRAGWRRWPGAS